MLPALRILNPCRKGRVHRVRTKPGIEKGNVAEGKEPKFIVCSQKSLANTRVTSIAGTFQAGPGSRWTLDSAEFLDGLVVHPGGILMIPGGICYRGGYFQFPFFTVSHICCYGSRFPMSLAARYGDCGTSLRCPMFLREGSNDTSAHVRDKLGDLV